MWRRVVLTAFASGCLLFPSLDDLSGGSDASVGDVAPDVPTNGDASTDVKIVDAKPEADVQAEAGPFCAQHSGATFCADFDEIADAAAGFTNTYLTTDGIVSRDTTAFASAPASLLAGAGPLDAAASSHAAEVRSTGVTPQNGFTFDMDFHIDKLDTTNNTYIESLALVVNASVKSSIQLNLKSTSSDVGEEIVGLDGGKTYVGHVFTTLATNTWVHVQIAVVFKPSRTLTLVVDGITVVDHVTLNAGFSGAGSVDLYLGNAYAPGPSTGASIHYDDAVLVVN
jgi:hypothetical protein